MTSSEHDPEISDARRIDPRADAAWRAWAAGDDLADDGAWRSDDPLAPVAREADNVEG
jgi:hypothetical protein